MIAIKPADPNLKLLFYSFLLHEKSLERLAPNL